MSIRAVTVYCSSSRDLKPAFYEAGDRLGREIARNQWELVYGGNRVGLMQTVADAARSEGGRMVGVTPQLFVDKGVGDPDCDELTVTADMRERKGVLERRGDAFLALPGGLGTFEEIFDIVVHRQLGYHNKPIVLINIDGYYNPLIQLIENGVAGGFIKIESRRLFVTAPTVDAAICHLRRDPSAADAPPPDPITSSAAE